MPERTVFSVAGGERRSAGRGAQLFARICLRARCNVDGLGGMGTKYLPTNKDRIANKRFQRKQDALAKVKQPSGDPSATKAKKR